MSLTVLSLKSSLFVILCGAALWSQQPQTAPAQAPKPEQPSNTPRIDYIQSAAQSSIFIYNGNTKPCDEQQPADNKPLLPVGSGFLVGITDRSAHPDPGKVVSWKLLVTAGHVIHASNGTIVVRLNRAAPSSGFACFIVPLVHEGTGQNLFTPNDAEAADVAAVLLPPMPDTDPVTFSFSLLSDRETMEKNEIRVGTNVFTVGYFFGYSGQKQNYPITKFGRISILTPERWFFSRDWKRQEEAYVVELQNTPGLSGAPIMTYGMEIRANPFQYRELAPMVIGIIKGAELAPIQTDAGIFAISQGIATVEPASHIKALVSAVADYIRKAGANPGLD